MVFGTLGSLFQAAVKVVTLPIAVVEDIATGSEQTKKTINGVAKDLKDAVEEFPG